jgi:hypothetical protein
MEESMSLDVLPSVPVHPTEELLEEYSFGRICEPALAPLEEHLLACPVCQSRLPAIDEYAAMMKAGIAAFERERRASPPHSRRFAFSGIPGIRMVFAAACMVVFVSATIAWRMQPPSTVASQAATVKLTALRGGEADGATRAPVGRPLDLVIDRTDLPTSLAYRLEVVSSSGRQIWSGAAQIADQNISAHVPNPLRPGMYWVRLYSSGDQLRREFGLHIE